MPALVALALGAAILTFPAAASGAGTSGPTGSRSAALAHASTERAVDPVAARALTDLRRFTKWLARGGRRGKGMIGEVGWPGDPASGGESRWNRIAAVWYAEAERASLWVAAWATGEFWAPSYKLLAYGASGGPVDRANAQAAVIEQQRAPELRGVNVAGAEFATPVDEALHEFSNVNRGTYGRDYVYPSQATLVFLASRGMTYIRLPVRWERLQPTLHAPLSLNSAAGKPCRGHRRLVGSRRAT